MDRRRGNGRPDETPMDEEHPRIRRLLSELEGVIHQFHVVTHALGWPPEVRQRIVLAVVDEIRRDLRPVRVRLPKGVTVGNGGRSRRRREPLDPSTSFSRRSRVR